MKREVMIEWVKALRSGKYVQGRGFLKSPDGYCCLGVLCEISQMSRFESQQIYLFEHYAGSTQALPSVVQDWAGMCTQDGTLQPNMTLASENDKGMHFNQIADLIEQNWEKL